MPRSGRPARGGRIACAVVACLLAGCYPRFDWRDHRPDCARTWCGFVASFPGRVNNATRDIPVGAMKLPLVLNVVSIDDVTFAVGAFELLPGSDADAARTAFERKLLDDAGATEGRRGHAAVRTADHRDTTADTLEAAGPRRTATARFVRRSGRLVEIVVVGPTDTLSTDRGRQAVETFMSSVRLD